MAEIELIIKIPEETANKIKDNALFAVATNEILWDVTIAIVNSTPLPKGHGDLIDRDELKNIWHGCKFVGSIDCLLDSRPTIIPADKEE